MTVLAIGYTTLSIVVMALLLFGYQTALKNIGKSPRHRLRKVGLAFVGILLWWLYTYLVASSGIVKDLSLPPKFPLLLIFPVFLFTAIVFYRARKSQVLHAIPVAWPVYFQGFRILVEGLFVASVAAGILHKEVTIEGYNMDMIYACTAVITGYLVFGLKKFSMQWALYWNYLGLAVIASIIFLFMTTLFVPQLWGHEKSVAPIGFLDFPYVMVASFLMPTAVFVHVLSIIQLTEKLSPTASTGDNAKR